MRYDRNIDMGILVLQGASNTATGATSLISRVDEQAHVNPSHQPLFIPGLPLFVLKNPRPLTQTSVSEVANGRVREKYGLAHMGALKQGRRVGVMTGPWCIQQIY